MLILSAEAAAGTGGLPSDAVAVFRGDFEAASDTNSDAWPDQWTRRRGPGYPTYVSVEVVDDERSSSANRCLQIRFDGGAAEVYSPTIRVSSRFNFMLDARIRIDGFKHNVVSCSVAFYDKSETLLETHESELIRESPQWGHIRLGPIRPASDRIHYAVVSVHARPTESADLWASVFVDDLVLYQLPKISLEMNRDVNIYTDPRDVQITCRVSGFTQANPRIRFELRDVHGQVHDTAEQAMSGGSPSGRIAARESVSGGEAGAGFAGQASWKPNVPGYGFYTIRLFTEGHAGWSVSLVVVPPLPVSERSEFGWTLPRGERPLSIKALPGLLNQAGVGWVKFPVWYGPSDRSRAEDLSWFAERLSTYRIKLVGVLDQAPAELKSAFGSEGWIPAATLFHDRAVWYPALDPVLTRLSLKVRWWQLGRDDDTSLSSVADREARVRGIQNDLTSFGQEVKVGLPCRTLDEPPRTASPPWSFLSFAEALPLTADEVRFYFDHPDMSHSGKWIMLECLSPRAYDLETRIRDLLLRALAAKIARVDGIFIADPFRADRGVMNSDGSPNELFLPWRTVAQLLGGTDYVGSVRLPGGSENHVFSRNGLGVMVAWSDQPVVEETYLGERVTLHDVWGQQLVAEETSAVNGKRQKLPLGPLPIFVTGVDPTIASWRMNFQLETTRLASVFGQRQDIWYRFKNTLSHAVAGRMTVEVPDGWKTEGADREFKVAPGEERRDRFRVALSPDVSCGTHPLRIEFQLNAEHDVQFQLWDSIEVGLGDVVTELHAQFDEKGNLVVEQHLINNTKQRVSFNCLLFVPERRREKRQVFDLGPGRATNTFVLPQGRELIGKTLWLRAEELNGARILNEKIVVQD
jgi:hypothetical protein